MATKTLLVLMSATIVFGQRPFFAGSKPIGYPEIIAITTQSSGLDNKFGEDDSTSSTTTQRLPLEALGDKNLVDRLSKLPVDKQPFWFINWQALEAHRKNPQSYPQRPSQFIVGTQAGNRFAASENVNSASGIINSASSVNSVTGNSNLANGNPNSGNGIPDSASGNLANGNLNSGNAVLSNRNGGEQSVVPSSGDVNNSDKKKPSGPVTSTLGDKNRVQSHFNNGANPSKPISGNVLTNQNNHYNTQHQVHFSNGYGYF